MRFKIHFHRYNPKSGESRKSAVLFIQAEDFHGAVGIAGHYLAGMREGGCIDELAISSIEADGYRDIECVDGLTIWETAEERAARFAEMEAR